MKKLFLSFMLLASAPVFASYHFQCYEVIGARTGEQMFLLIPNLADLNSGASFSLSTDETIIENFTFLNETSHKMKRGSIKLLGSNGSLLKIDHKGVERSMQIKTKDKVTTDYQCFIESSI